MKSIKELKSIVKKGLELVKKEKGLIEAQVYASANIRTVGRICYTSNIPSNGLEEAKSDEDFGLSVEVWLEKDGKKLLGFGQETNDLSIEAVKRALFKAKRDAVEDNDFRGFLKSSEFPHKYNVPKNYLDTKIINISFIKEAKLLAKISWETIRGAIDEIQNSQLKIQNSSFILNGDNFIIRERMAIASTNGIYDSDESTVILAYMTAMLEKANAKGSAWSANLKFHDKSSYQLGKDVVTAAIKQIGGVRMPGGKYTVIFGPQAVTELFGSLYLSHLNLGMLDFGVSINMGKFGKQVASPLLDLYDDATLKDGAGTKRITCEGRPTEKTWLIKKGKLVGFLADSKIRNKILYNHKNSKVKLGVDPLKIKDAIEAKNGYRFARGGGRVAAAGVGISATNLVIDSSKSSSEREILTKVKNGIYIGRLWYTYPVGGYASGIITGTAIADNFVINNGIFSHAISPNVLRLEDNIGEMMRNIIAIGNNRKQTILWASDEITHAPWVVIKNVNFKAILKI